MDRNELRRKCFKIHSNYQGRYTCPLSGKEIGIKDSWDLHEVFVEKNDVAPPNQYLINVVENCIPLDHDAHIDRGSTKSSMAKCTPKMFRNVGTVNIGEWYVSLWREHDLSMNRGMLIPIEDLSVTRLVEFMNLGAEIHQKPLPAARYWLNEGIDYRAAIATKYKGKNRHWARGTPNQWKEYYASDLIYYIEEGYWARYMLDVFGMYDVEWA